MLLLFVAYKQKKSEMINRALCFKLFFNARIELKMQRDNLLLVDGLKIN